MKTIKDKISEIVLKYNKELSTQWYILKLLKSIKEGNFLETIRFLVLSKLGYIFKKVEMETGTLCNRSCPYCPVSKYPRKGKKMKWKVFKKIIHDLSEIPFVGTINFHRYNEPLLDKRLEKMVSYTKKELPNVIIQIFTNGDFLNKETYKKLRKAGVYSFVVTSHWQKERGNVKRKENIIPSFYKDLSEKERKKVLFNRTITTNELPINMANRGGLVECLEDEYSTIEKKDCPIMHRAGQLHIDYKGRVLLCCHQYRAKDGPVFGNVLQNDLLDIWNSYKFRNARDKLRKKNRPFDICNKCKRGLWFPKDL